jgi:hypothetical protein
MKRTTIPAAFVALLLGGCAPTAEDQHAVTVTEEETSATVEVNSVDDRVVRTAVQHAVDTIEESEKDGGWFIYVVCDEGVTGFVKNAVGLVRFAKGEAGATATGLPEGELDFRLYGGATCPGTAAGPVPE